MGSIKISVIIPVYNMEQYVRQCLDSILSQSLQEIELVCVNDGSKDHSLEILREYTQKDRRVQVIDQENTGVGQARNNGILAATGEYVIFMDPDDWYPDNTVLESLYMAAKAHHVLICGGSFSNWVDGTVSTKYPPIDEGYTFRQDGLVQYRDYQFDYGYHRFIYQRDMLVKNGILFPKYARFQDPPFFVRAMIQAGEFYALKRVVYRYRCAYKALQWKEKNATDMLQGMTDNLNLSREYGLEKLHARTIERLNRVANSESFMALLEAHNPAVFMGLLKANAAVDVALLRKYDQETPEPILLKPLSAVYEAYHSGQALDMGKLSMYEKENQAIKSSASYQIGRFITWIPRKVRGALQCYREHGFRYTWNEIFNSRKK